MDDKKNIAYLSHEIPGLSSTFVYNEILSIIEEGYSVDTFSIHKVENNFKTEQLTELASNTTYLYEHSLVDILTANIKLVFSQPAHYLKTLFMCIGDLSKLIKSPKLVAGTCYRFLVGGLTASHLKKKEIQHLHIHFADIPSDIGMYAALLAKIDYSVTAHANDIFERHWLINEKISRSKFFATISNYNIRLLTSRGADTQKLNIVRCGVDSTKFQSREAKAKSSPVRFGLVGRLVEKKGTHILIEACAELCKTQSDFTIEIVGDGPEMTALNTQAKRLRVNGHIQFLGSKAHADIAQWLDTLDYFVLPCVKDSNGDMDGIPVALMEAMLRGVPVISTDISGVPELVIGDKTGLCVPNNNSSALATTLAQAITEPELETLKRIENAKAIVKSEYDGKNNVLKLISLIEKH